VFGAEIARALDTLAALDVCVSAAIGGAAVRAAEPDLAGVHAVRAPDCMALKPKNKEAASFLSLLMHLRNAAIKF
jgi:hypothetical protein